jgi:cytochrome d ubiquinol oxidase subunit I
MENIDWGIVNWARAEFALTILYHWIFVPLTLGLSFMLAIIETIAYKTGDDKWIKIEKFWLKLFVINFVVGAATGVIMEFEFGQNWSNYSYFVGDIFGAPLAIEGIMAFFMESVFIALVVFGWNKLSKRAHLISIWFMAIGTNLSALWILVANGWMQNPVGMKFNPDTMRNEMVDFWEVLFNPIAMNKFIHVVTSAYTFSALFVIGISSLLILRNKDKVYAKYSMLVASVFGVVAILTTMLAGHGSAQQVAKHQPLKLAAMEGVYEGEHGAPLTLIGIPYLQENDNRNLLEGMMDDMSGKNQLDVRFKSLIEIPYGLSFLAHDDPHAFIPGVKDIVLGNKAEGIPSHKERVSSGKTSINALKAYKEAKKLGETEKAQTQLAVFEKHFDDFGYGYFDGLDPNKLIPPITLTFISFHTMVALGSWFLVFFVLVLIAIWKDNIEKKRWLLKLGVWGILFGWMAQESGWMTAEMGRLPWVVQDMMPTFIAMSHISKLEIIITFSFFAFIFTLLLIAEIKIMLTTIRKGFNQ